MDKDIFIVEGISHNTLSANYLGDLVITPDRIYFIARAFAGNLLLTAYAGMASFNGAGDDENILMDLYNVAKEELGNLHDKIEKLDQIVGEKEGSIVVNHLEINKVKVKTGLVPLVKVITNEKKFRFELINKKKKNTLHEAKEFLMNNRYTIN